MDRAMSMEVLAELQKIIARDMKKKTLAEPLNSVPHDDHYKSILRFLAEPMRLRRPGAYPGCLPGKTYGAGPKRGPPGGNVRRVAVPKAAPSGRGRNARAAAAAPKAAYSGLGENIILIVVPNKKDYGPAPGGNGCTTNSSPQLKSPAVITQRINRLPDYKAINATCRLIED